MPRRLEATLFLLFLTTGAGCISIHVEVSIPGCEEHDPEGRTEGESEDPVPPESARDRGSVVLKPQPIRRSIPRRVERAELTPRLGSAADRTYGAAHHSTA